MGPVINRGAITENSTASKNAFKGLRKVVFGCNGTALFRHYSEKFAFIRLFNGGGDLRIRRLQIRRTEVAKKVQNSCRNLHFVRPCPRLPALSAFARLFFAGREDRGRRAGDKRLPASVRKRFLDGIWRVLFRLFSLGGGGGLHEIANRAAKCY